MILGRHWDDCRMVKAVANQPFGQQHAETLVIAEPFGQQGAETSVITEPSEHHERAPNAASQGLVNRA